MYERQLYHDQGEGMKMMWNGLFDGGAQLELNKELLSHYIDV